MCDIANIVKHELSKAGATRDQILQFAFLHYIASIREVVYS